ncbi:glutaredoxin family protein, partial [Candidatus Altiarchaeota archaeon]
HSSHNILALDGNGNPVEGVEIFKEGVLLGESDKEGRLFTEALSSGAHVFNANKTGYAPVEKSFEVDRSRYGMSLEVRGLLSDSERHKAIKGGKASVRFYETPSCPNCKKVKDYMADILASNRECILYEVINLWAYQEELEGKFPKMTTPIIEIEGNEREFMMNGLVPSKTLKRRISDAMSGECEFQWI